MIPRDENGRLNTIGKKLDDGFSFYISDALFYSLWKYLNAKRLTGKNLIDFEDLTGLGVTRRMSTYNFLSKLKELDLSLDGILFHTEIYKQFFGSEFLILSNYIKQNSGKKVSRSLNKLFQGQADFEDLVIIFTPFNGLTSKETVGGLLEYIEFSSEHSAKKIKKLADNLENYIQLFKTDKLFSLESKNYYRYPKQKEIFLYNIEREVLNFGSDFIFKQGECVSVNQGGFVSIGDNESYLFIHTLATMEEEEFFDIENILILDKDIQPEKNTEDYKIKITSGDKLLCVCEEKQGARSVVGDSVIQKKAADKYKISVKDREIWVNDYLIGKPHAVGKNFEFFEYVRFLPPNTKINRDNMPNASDKVNFGYIKEEVKNKSFIKILNGLGFKGELLKAYFYKRSKDNIVYMGDEISVHDLEKAGVKIDILLRELELAHIKNSPK